jgi:hypothetical protein
VTNIYHSHNYYIQVDGANDLEAVLRQLQHRESCIRPNPVAELPAEGPPPSRRHARPPQVRKETKPVWYTRI